MGGRGHAINRTSYSLRRYTAMRYKIENRDYSGSEAHQTSCQNWIEAPSPNSHVIASESSDTSLNRPLNKAVARNWILGK
ncbi:hypothetical protein QJS10_CPA06g00855 [Acorus calamus]|uniref:Uncharacterized protein n=1 Tax=Acorus calamus TaxID=4465 RepID=A0AAV9EPN2_ACOCL|nr:hypothetical protein QJS10_CPA06g00855 [Acorus calamus]